MYYVSKRMEIAGAHNLTLNYEKILLILKK